jgi:hypothetical protein
VKKILLGILLAMPATGVAQTGDGCRDGIEAYQKAPTVSRLKPLLPCLDDADPRVRALVFDKLVRREVWSEPQFKDVYPQLRAAAAKGRRDHDYRVSSFASGMDMWLDNSLHDERDRAKAAAAATEAGRSDTRNETERMRIRLSLVFGAGVVAQSLVFVLGSGQTRLVGLGAAAFIGLFGMLPGKHENVYEPHFHLALCFILYAFAVFAQFKKEIMARVSQSNLLVNSLTLWFLCASFLGGESRVLMMSLAALPTLGTLIVAFTIREWSFPVKLACYVWFLLLTIANCCFQVRFGNLAFLFLDSFAPPNPIDLFMTGMAFTVMAASLFYVYLLIPLQRKNETWEARTARWREDAHAMAGCFADYRLTAPEAMQIIVVQGSIYALNHWARWMLPGVMMNVSMVVLPLGFQLLFRRRQPAPGAATAFAA